VGRTPARCLAIAAVVLAAVPARGDPPTFVAVPGLPPAVVRLAGGERPEAFAWTPSVSLVALRTADAQRSVIRVGSGDRVQEISIAGKVAALLASPAGGAWAIVRESDRKGVDRRASLVPIEAAAGRIGRGVPVPASARGLALSARADAILVTSVDEIRTFVLPHLTSGPLYRVPGPNVGMAPAPWGGTVWVVAQAERVGLLDVSQPQGREGFALQDAAPSPMPLRALVAGPDQAPLAVGETGDAWRLEIHPPERAADVPPPIPDPVPLPVPHDEPPMPPPAPKPEPEPEPVPTPAPAPAPTPVPDVSPPGTLTGVLSGPAMAGVAFVLALGPDNVLRESARVAPSADGSYRFQGLPPGNYRLVGSGAGGRVVICEPPFLTVKLEASQPVTAPEWRAVRVP
jgi:hypothetical protein